jgi:hypothetical protein
LERVLRGPLHFLTGKDFSSGALTENWADIKQVKTSEQRGAFGTYRRRIPSFGLASHMLISSVNIAAGGPNGAWSLLGQKI